MEQVTRLRREQQEASDIHEAALQELRHATSSKNDVENSLGEMSGLHDQLLASLRQSQQDSHALKAALSEAESDKLKMQAAMVLQRVRFLCPLAGLPACMSNSRQACVVVLFSIQVTRTEVLLLLVAVSQISISFFVTVFCLCDA